MKQKREAVISEQFVKFLQCFNHWIKERYLNEFNINGKGNQPLTNQQFCILKAVEDITDCTISKLENEMHVSRSSLSIGVSKLVKEGYIRRQYPNEEDDRRKMYLYLTDQGEKVLKEIYGKLFNIIEKFYIQLDEEQKEDFEKSIEKLLSIFKK